MSGTCPHCNHPVATLVVSCVTADLSGGDKWQALTYNCPNCNKILGCQMDPIALDDDLVKDLVEALRKQE